MNLVKRTIAVTVIGAVSVIGAGSAASAAEGVTSASSSSSLTAARESQPLSIRNNLDYAIQVDAPFKARIEPGATFTYRSTVAERGDLVIVVASNHHDLFGAELLCFQGNWKIISPFLSKVNYTVTSGTAGSVTLG